MPGRPTNLDKSMAKAYYAFSRLDGWMTWDFSSFSTVFQSYQDDGRMIMKGSVQWNPFTIEKILARGSNSRPLDQEASA